MIRNLELSDLKELERLAQKTFTQTFGHSFTEEQLSIELKETRSEVYFRSALENDRILVATEDKSVVGYIQLSHVAVDVIGIQPSDKDRAIHALYIHSDYQGKGLGKALMDAAFKDEYFSDAEYVYIDVWDENKRAVDFYIKYGFQRIGQCAVVVNGEHLGYDLVLRRLM